MLINAQGQIIERSRYQSLIINVTTHLHNILIIPQALLFGLFNYFSFTKMAPKGEGKRGRVSE